METLRFVPDDDEEDLYSGFNDFPSALFNTKDLDQDEYVQMALRSSYSKRPGLVTSKPGTAMRFGTSSGYREGSVRMATGHEAVTRPMTAVRGAGYTSATRAVFDPLNQAAAAPLQMKLEEKPEDKIKKLERRITELIDESCLANSRQQYRQALDKAKEASTKERNLIRLQEQAGLSDSHNLDLTFSATSVSSKARFRNWNGRRISSRCLLSVPNKIGIGRKFLVGVGSCGLLCLLLQPSMCGNILSQAFRRFRGSLGRLAGCCCLRGVTSTGSLVLAGVNVILSTRTKQF